MNKTVQSAFYSYKSITIAIAVSLVYFITSYLLIGFKTDQLVLVFVFNTCFFASTYTRKFIIGFSIFIVYWIIFDYMKAFPNYTYNTVHIQDLYNAEKALFGININGKIITPNEFWIANHSTWIDVATGIFYLCWIPVPLAFAFYLFVKDKQLFLHFSITFVLVNFIGFVLYYLYPAAPPWYMQQFGTNFIAGTKGNTAGLNRFDSVTGLNVFHNLYAKSSNVFAAMPSLHSAYPLIVVYYGFQKKVGIVATILFTIVMLGIWFAAIYTSHHYVLDVLAGIAVAVLGILIFQKIMLRIGWYRSMLQSFYERLV